MIISRTPYRVSLFGGGSDYPRWFSQNGGACLVGAIDRFCYVTLRYQPQFFAEHISRVCWSKVEVVSNNLEIENPAVRGTLEYFNKADVGLEIHHQGDLPARSGMGSSSSFVVGLLNAHWALTEEPEPKYVYDLSRKLSSGEIEARNREHAQSLAKTAIRIEREFVGDEVGVQDQTAAAYGGVNLLVVDKDGGIEVRPCSRQICDELEKRLILVYLGTTRHASEIAKVQVAEMGKHEDAMRQMMLQAHFGYRMLTGDLPLDGFPEALNSAWELKRSLSPIISNGFVDDVREGLMANGAEAVKLIGAGSGGFMLAYVDDRQRLVDWAVANKFLCVPFRFCYTGSEIIFRGQS